MKKIIYFLIVYLTIYAMSSCQSREQNVANKPIANSTVSDAAPQYRKKALTDTLFYISDSLNRLNEDGRENVGLYDTLVGILDPRLEGSTGAGWILIGDIRYVTSNLVVVTKQNGVKVKFTGLKKGSLPIDKYASMVGPPIELTSIELYNEATDAKYLQKKKVL